MQRRVDAGAGEMRVTDDFLIEASPAGSPNMLQFKGRPIMAVPGQVVEAQFSLPDQSTLLLISDNTPFKEMLTLCLIGPDLRERDQVKVGGAYSTGFLAYAERLSPEEIAFCWHDLDLVVTVRRYWSWLSLRRRWLSLRDTVPQRAPAARAGAPTP